MPLYFFNMSGKQMENFPILSFLKWNFILPFLHRFYPNPISKHPLQAPWESIAFRHPNQICDPINDSLVMLKHIRTSRFLSSSLQPQKQIPSPGFTVDESKEWFLASRGSEKVLLLAMTFTICLILNNFVSNFQYFPCTFQFGGEKKLNILLLVLGREGVVVEKRRKWMTLQERKFAISITQSFLAVKSITYGVGNCYKYYP